MSCRLHAAAIADLARDVVIHTDIATTARAHLTECRRCARRFERLRELSADLRRLAAAHAAATPSSGVKDRVLAAAAAQRVTVVMTPRPVLGAPGGRPQRRPRRTSALLWTAAAAALLVAAVGLAVWSGASEPKGPPASAPAVASVRPAPTSPPVRVTASASTAVAGSRTNRPRRQPVRPAAPIEDFVAVPGSAALPELESGRIVRVELPVAALPAYGVDIAPHAARLEIAADLLIGQDGHTRAIRLVQTREQP